MKIAVIDPGCITPIYNSYLCKALAFQEIEIYLVTAPYKNDNEYVFHESFETIFLFYKNNIFSKNWNGKKALKGIFYSFYIAKMFFYIKRKKIDIIHFQWMLIPPIDFFFIKIFRLMFPRVKIICTVHDVEPLFSIIGHSYIQKCYNLMDAIICHGDFAKAKILEKNSTLSYNLIHVIPHGPIHNTLSSYTSITYAAQKNFSGAPKRKIRGLLFGELKPYKGIDVLMDALLKAPNELIDNLEILVVGKAEDSTTKEILDKLELMSSCIKIIRGYVPNKMVSMYFNAADFLILPYKKITQSGVLLTGLSHGKPVLATDLGDLGNLVRDLDAGWLVPANDPSALCDALCEIIKLEVSELHMLGETSKIKLFERYSWESIALKTIACYRNIYDR
jgi:glycosyltransferase involved in cell wall biosynthesis